MAAGGKPDGYSFNSGEHISVEIELIESNPHKHEIAASGRAIVNIGRAARLKVSRQTGEIIQVGVGGHNPRKALLRGSQ